MFAPEIGGRSGFIFPEYTGQLGGTVVAYLPGNLLDGEVRIDKKLFGGAQPFLVKTEEIGLADLFFKKGANVVGMHFYCVSEVIKRDVVLIIFSDIFQKLLNLGVIAGVLMVGGLLKGLFNGRKCLENFVCKPGNIILTRVNRLVVFRKGKFQTFQIQGNVVEKAAENGFCREPFRGDGTAVLEVFPEKFQSL